MQFINPIEAMDIVTKAISNSNEQTPDYWILSSFIEKLNQIKNDGKTINQEETQDLYECIIYCFDLYNEFIIQYKKDLPLITEDTYNDIEQVLLCLIN